MAKRHHSEAHRRFLIYVRAHGLTVSMMASKLQISPVQARQLFVGTPAPGSVLRRKIAMLTAEHHSGPIRAVDWERPPI